MEGRSLTSKTCTHTISTCGSWCSVVEITITRDGNPETFRAGEHCELAEGCQHTTKVGPEGVALIVRKGLSAGPPLPKL